MSHTVKSGILLNMDIQLVTAWIAAGAGFIGIIGTNLMQVWESRQRRHQEILNQRKEALFAALQVVDHYFSNCKVDDWPPPNPHHWDIGLARDAMSKMVIFCKDPQRTVTAFKNALGLNNPNTQSTTSVGFKALHEFRVVVAEELEVPPVKYEDEDFTWIACLDGAVSEEWKHLMESKRRGVSVRISVA